MVIQIILIQEVFQKFILKTDRVPEEPWTEVCDIVQEAVIKRNAKKQNGCLRRSYRYLRKEEKLKAKEKRKNIPI